MIAYLETYATTGAARTRANVAFRVREAHSKHVLFCHSCAGEFQLGLPMQRIQTACSFTFEYSGLVKMTTQSNFV